MVISFIQKVKRNQQANHKKLRLQSLLCQNVRKLYFCFPEFKRLQNRNWLSTFFNNRFMKDFIWWYQLFKYKSQRGLTWSLFVLLSWQQWRVSYGCGRGRTSAVLPTFGGEKLKHQTQVKPLQIWLPTPVCYSNYNWWVLSMCSVRQAYLKSQICWSLVQSIPGATILTKHLTFTTPAHAHIRLSTVHSSKHSTFRSGNLSERVETFCLEFRHDTSHHPCLKGT